MDSSKNGKWIIPFKKFSRLRVNSKFFMHNWLKNMIMKLKGVKILNIVSTSRIKQISLKF